MKIGIYCDPSVADSETAKHSSVFLAGALGRRFDVEIVSHAPLSTGHLVESQTTNLKIREIGAPPKLVIHPGDPLLGYQKLRDWSEELTQRYDLFINYSDGLPIYCAAPRGVVVVQSPRGWMSSQYRWLCREHLERYKLRVTPSHYARMLTRVAWDIDSELIPPGFDPCLAPDETKKLLVCLDSNRPHLAIAIRKLKAELTDWTIREGLTMKVTRNKAGEGSKSQPGIYIHASGYQRDATHYRPPVVPFSETLQAMHAGLVPLVPNIGSFPEIIRHGESGFFWNTPEELTEHALFLARNPDRHREMAKGARQRSRFFSKDVYAATFLQHLESTFNIKSHTPLNRAMLWQRIKTSASEFLVARR